MKRTALVLISVVLVSLYGCAWVGKSTVVPTNGLQGRLEDNVYLSPAGDFRLRLPRLSGNGVEIRDERPSESTLRVSIKDDLCREFIVSQRPVFLGTTSLVQWVGEHIVEPLKAEGYKVQEPKPVQARQGTAVALRYRVPGGAPCNGKAVKDGAPVESRADADVGWYVFHHGGAVYRLIYVLGLVANRPGSLVTQWWVKREPVDDVLAEFAEGFEIVDAKSN